MSAGQFTDYSRRIIDQEITANRQIIIVGGTGFYLKALTQPNLLARVPANEFLRSKLNQIPLVDLQRRLKHDDPARLAEMNQSDAHNPRRLIRAIEIAQTLSISAPRPAPNPFRNLNFSWVGINISLLDLKSKIAIRVDRRLISAISEVKTLFTNYPDRSLPIYTTLGVRPILRFLDGEIDRSRLRSIWTTDEINYAKRQLTWFKKQDGIIWYDQDRVSSLHECS